MKRIRNKLFCKKFHSSFKKTTNSFLNFLKLAVLHLTLQVTEVFAARISETVGFAGLQKFGGAKYHKGRSPTGVLRNPSRLQAAKLLPGVRRSFYKTLQIYFLPTFLTIFLRFFFSKFFEKIVLKTEITFCTGLK